MMACKMNVMPLPVREPGNSRRTIHRDVLRSPVDRARQTASLSREMKLEVQVEEVLKRFPRDLPDRVLSDACKSCVQQLCK